MHDTFSRISYVRLGKRHGAFRNRPIMGFSAPSKNKERDAASAGTNNGPVVLDTGRVRRMILMLLVPAIICIVGVALLMLTLAGERLPELTEAELEKAEELWTSAAPASYEMDLEILQGQPGTVHIEVQNGEISAMTRDNRTPAQRTWRIWSVPGLFETLERELEMAEDPVHEVGAAAGTRWQLRCEFDSVYGYPRRFHRYVSGGGPEVYWRVTSFVPK
jgi:hypothetical protein